MSTSSHRFAYLACLLLAPSVWAQDARQIMQESQKRGQVKSERYEGLLQVYESNGKMREKRWVYDRIGSYGSSKALLRFTEPAEVNGVALLIANRPDRASEQWMWTPAIGRERRIALQDRSTRFFGTDFSFEDMEERDLDQFDFKLDGENDLGWVKCWRIEATPKRAKASQYSRLMIWVRQDHYVIVQLDDYVKDEVARRLQYSQIAEVQGIWTARLLDMAELRRKSHTTLHLDKVEYNVPMRDDDFTVQALRVGQ